MENVTVNKYKCQTQSKDTRYSDNFITTLYNIIFGNDSDIVKVSLKGNKPVVLWTKKGGLTELGRSTFNKYIHNYNGNLIKAIMLDYFTPEKIKLPITDDFDRVYYENDKLTKIGQSKVVEELKNN